VSRLLDSGAYMAIVAKMAGHSNIQTTARYDRRSDEAKRRAANLLQIPYAESIEKIKLIKESAPSIYVQRMSLDTNGFSKCYNYYYGSR
jgi:hypothetical protein